MSKPRQFWILENRCAMPMRCYETALQAFNEMEGNDDVVPVIEFSAYQSAIEELKAARAEMQAIAKNNCYDCACEAPAEDAVARIDKFLKEIE